MGSLLFVKLSGDGGQRVLSAVQEKDQSLPCWAQDCGSRVAGLLCSWVLMKDVGISSLELCLT